ncbi:MAG: DUF47 family protein [Candidatus Bathyarchaeia archaeon]
MVFPVESEDRVMRNLLMLFQDNSRILVEAFRGVLSYTDALSDRSALKGNPSESIDQLMEDSYNLKNTLIQEVNDIGGVLSNREDFFRLISTFGDIIDHIEVVSIRLAEILKQEWGIPEHLRKGIADMADLGFKALTQFREAIMSLGFNSQKALRFTQRIDETERKLDSIYVKVDIDIINSAVQVPIILILRDVANIIESMVDAVRNASDLVRIISI